MHEALRSIRGSLGAAVHGYAQFAGCHSRRCIGGVLWKEKEFRLKNPTTFNEANVKWSLEPSIRPNQNKLDICRRFVEIKVCEFNRKEIRRTGVRGQRHIENTWVSPGPAWSPCLALED